MKCGYKEVLTEEERSQVAAIRAAAKAAGVPVGSFQRARLLMESFSVHDGYTVEQQCDAIANAIYEAYRRGHEIGRAYQRQLEKRERR